MSQTSMTIPTSNPYTITKDDGSFADILDVEEGVDYNPFDPIGNANLSPAAYWGIFTCIGGEEFDHLFKDGRFKDEEFAADMAIAEAVYQEQDVK